MIGDAIAAFVGHKIDSSDGEGGAVGAVAGVAAWKAAKTIIPAVLFFGAIAWGIQYLANQGDDS